MAEKSKSTEEIAETITKGYAFDSTCIELGAAMIDGEVVTDAKVRVPLSMMNRHGLVAGATGTGKTKTLQLIAEQLSNNGVPVFLADIKGDLSGLLDPGEANPKVDERAQKVGQTWAPQGFPVEFLALGGEGLGVPVRTEISNFGPLLLSRVLELNETQEQVLQLIFHYADQKGLWLDDVKDLRTLITFLTSDAGKSELEGIGGVSKQSADVILRALTTFEASGADKFFGRPAFDPADLLKVDPSGKGVITCLELAQQMGRPVLFSTFLMWLLAELFETLPEVGDADKPKLVFFLDEAHLLFTGASKAFLESITQTVRLIRSKGVGVFFITQTPKDVPGDVLAQLANRVQHALRAFTPEDAKALKATVTTFPKSDYDLEEVLPACGIGEAVITVMSDRGAPTPVAWTMLRAVESKMAPADETEIQARIDASELKPKYATEDDRESAYEMLTAKAAQEAAAAQAGADAAAAQEAENQRIRAEAEAAAQAAKEQAAAEKAAAKSSKSSRSRKEDESMVEQVLSSSTTKSVINTATREIMRSIFGTGRRRR